MYIPSKSKYKKQQKGKSFCKICNNTNILNNNAIGLKSLEVGRFSSKQFKTLKQIVTKKIKKTGELIIKIFPQTPITKKPLEIRMGKGKGAVNYWVSKIKPGFIFCYIISNNKTIAKKALQMVQVRLPIKTQIIFR